MKIRETLTRIGLATEKDGRKVLYQSCHILHKRGRYVILHFKELFSLDGKASTISETDIQRRNTIVAMLANWNLCEITVPDSAKNQMPESEVRVIPHREKANWTLVAKYEIGKKRKPQNST